MLNPSWEKLYLTGPLRSRVSWEVHGGGCGRTRSLCPGRGREGTTEGLPARLAVAKDWISWRERESAVLVMTVGGSPVR